MLTHLRINNLRNLVNLQLDPSDGFNIIYGSNGSGKTSILEAVYMLSIGRSFRTSLINRIIHNEQESLTLFGQIVSPEGQASIGLRRHRGGECQMKLAGTTVNSISELTKALPVQVIHPESHRLLTDGPKLRRQLLDWGVFHVEHSFYQTWQRTQRALKQRNAEIKKSQSKQRVNLWNKEFIENATALNKQRQLYFERLRPLFNQVIQHLLPNLPVRFNFYPGWNIELDLESILNQAIDRDLELGYTQFGPQRADLRIKIDTTPAQDALSQGQQKLIVYGLKLAQGHLYQGTSHSTLIYLIDDLPAELDIHKRQLVIEILSSLKSQIFITGAEHSEMEDLVRPGTKLFHVKHGKIA